MMTAEQMIAANKASVDTLFGLSHKAFAGIEKLVELNMTAAKAAMSDNQDHVHALMSVTDVQELMALQAGYLQPLSEKAVSFSRHMYEIATSTGSEFTKAMEDKAAETQKTVSNLVDSAVKNAPAGSAPSITGSTPITWRVGYLLNSLGRSRPMACRANNSARKSSK